VTAPRVQDIMEALRARVADNMAVIRAEKTSKILTMDGEQGDVPPGYGLSRSEQYVGQLG
jgi:hypothetical protein